MTDPHADTAEGIARVAMDLDEADGVDETVDVSLEYARAAVGADAASVMLLERGGRDIKVVGTTGEAAARADQLQIDAGEGPCLQAAQGTSYEPVATDAQEMVGPYSFTTFEIEDTLTEERWPTWASGVADDPGFRSVLSIQLKLPRTRIGVLNLYAATPQWFSAHDRQIAELLAQHTAIALASARRDVNLWQAIDACQLIGQAQGLLMERFGLDPNRAFAVLTRYSQNNNVKLHDVAERLVRTGRLPHAVPAPGADPRTAVSAKR